MNRDGMALLASDAARHRTEDAVPPVREESGPPEGGPLRRRLLAILGLGLAIACVLAVGRGPVTVSPFQVVGILFDALGGSLPVDFTPQQQAVLLSIRLPRVLFGALIGAALALAGGALQGLFRNPLADPALIGVSAGASLAVATVIVIGAVAFPGALRIAGVYALPVAGFGGGLVATGLIYALARADGRTSLATMLLAGIAMNALAMAAVGAYSFLATDEQLRNLTFWTFGSLGAAQWSNTLLLALVVVAGAIVLFRAAPALDALALGEAVAGHVGFSPQRVKRQVIVTAALLAGCAVAFSGVISFVALVAPHLVRLIAGPGHRLLLPASALLGGILLVVADLAARTLVAPAELPIGVVTAFLGAPFFLALLYKERHSL